jgi:hypothetical protein
MFEEGADEPGAWADAILVDSTQSDFKNRIDRPRIGLFARGRRIRAEWTSNYGEAYELAHESNHQIDLSLQYHV